MYLDVIDSCRWLFTKVNQELTNLGSWVYTTIYNKPDVEERYVMIMKGNTRMFETYMDLSDNNMCKNDVLWAID